MSLQSDLLFKLPASLAGEILGDWLNLKELVVLDSAFCNHKLRSCWLQQLQAEELVYSSKISQTSDNLWAWLILKDLKISSLDFNDDSEGTDLTVFYFSKHGSAIRAIRINDGLEFDMALIARYCDRLTRFECLSTVLDISFQHILHRNLNLEVLHLGGLTELTVAQFDGLSLPNLHTISLNNCPSCSDEIVHKLTKLSSKLTKIGLLFCLEVTNPTLKKLLPQFPRLQALGLGGLQVDNDTLNTITKACPHISNLFLYGNRAVTDAGLQKTLQHLPELRSLDIQACASLTDQTLANIAKHNASTLEVLHIGEKMSYSVGCVGSMLTACTCLRSFIWSARSDITFSQSDLTEAFHALRNIKTLLLGDGMACDAALITMAQHCTQLQHLNIYSDRPDPEDENFDENEPQMLHYSDEGVFAVAQGCTSLRTVVCKDDEVINSLAKRFWKQLQPQIEFSGNDQLFCVSILNESL